MSKKIILLLMVMALPFILIARGNREGEQGQAALLEEAFSDLLGQMDQGEITPAEAREELKMMQNRFSLREEVREGMDEALSDVEAQKKTPGEAVSALSDQLKDRDRLQDRDPDQDRDKLQDQDCEPDQDQDRTRDGSGGGSGPNS